MDLQLQRAGSVTSPVELREEDVGRLSPLGHEHINMLGRYAFSLPDRIARGELRPLRNPRRLDEAA
jgi:hypothetical protein